MNFTFSTYEKLTGATEQTPAYSLVSQGNGYFFAKKGAMVADQGNFKYEKVLLDPNAGGNIIGGVINQMARRVTGENMEIMKVSGDGLCVLAWNGHNVTVFPLQPGERVGVEAENLLAFTANIKYGVRFIGAGVLSQKGLFTTNLENNSGQIAYVAIITDGNAIVLNSPCRVDPDAIICWTGADPALKMDVNWKTLVGQSSGESYMFGFNNPGQKVVIQPSERKSGLHIGMDGGEDVQTQAGPNFGFGQQSGMGNPNQGFGGQGMGDPLSQIGNIAGNLFRR